jgi:nucleoside-diphosphate-sugar epimerase
MILVTGAAGLIGSRVVSELERNGYDVFPCDIRFKRTSLDFLSEDILSLLKQCDGIIHLAAISRVIHGEVYPELCNKINVTNTIKFFDVCKSLPHKPWIIYGSSREVYGEPDSLPVSEITAISKPINNYARGKVAIENVVLDLQNAGLKTSILRFSNVYGGMMDHYDRVVPAFCVNAINGSDIKIEGQECVFDFTYIDDVVNGVLLTVKRLEESKDSLPPIHLTTGRPCNLGTLAQIALNITGRNSKINLYPPRNFDVQGFYGDFTRARDLLGWAPKYSLEEGVSKFIKDLTSADINTYPKDIDMVIYENIKSYSWLPSLL